MRDRRLQIGMISMHIISSWGKELGTKIKEFLPDDAIVLKQEEDVSTASMRILIHHSSFDDVPEGAHIPQVVLPIPLKEKEEPKTKLIYDH